MCNHWPPDRPPGSESYTSSQASPESSNASDLNPSLVLAAPMAHAGQFLAAHGPVPAITAFGGGFSIGSQLCLAN